MSRQLVERCVSTGERVDEPQGAKVRKVCLLSGIICELGGGCPAWLYTSRCTVRHPRLLAIGSTIACIAPFMGKAVSATAHGVC